MKNLGNIQVDEANIFTWQELTVPDKPPYNKGALIIKINFPTGYPFKPPNIMGQVCPVISAENWKPATKMNQVIQSLVALLNDPQPEHPLQAGLTEEYFKGRDKFCKNAEESTENMRSHRPQRVYVGSPKQRTQTSPKAGLWKTNRYRCRVFAQGSYSFSTLFLIRSSLGKDLKVKMF
ncbi:unnamed protein product [Nyctereutes procyonoides]|uniref:(raccoon dog) hypothetical protein n=1 Tax=Nyctereutes procyonoides TaxID=34880 RepID=A0A811ZEH7_NYCPR|nr:unnamed protein product [Nyctereutes procyonoides]